MLFTIIVLLLLVLTLVVSGVQSESESKLDATSHGCVFAHRQCYLLGTILKLSHDTLNILL